jgi:hypothetical protein
VAAAGVAQGNRELVADQLAATTGETCPLLLAVVGGEPSHEAVVWEYGAADRGVARGKRVEDGSKVRMIVNRVKGMAMRDEVCAQAPGASTLLGRTGEQWGCRTSTTPSRVSLERRNRLFSKGNGSILAHGWDKMEIPAKGF